MTTASMNFKADKAVKQKFDSVASQLGVSSSALLNIFVTRVAREGAIPFKVEIVPNKETSLDPESQREMIKVMAIEAGLLPDDNITINDVNEFFEGLPNVPN